MARFRRTIQDMTSDIRRNYGHDPSNGVFGGYLSLNTGFINALTQIPLDDVAEEFFDTLQGNSEITTVTFVFVEYHGTAYERLGHTLGTLTELSQLRFTLMNGKAAVAWAASMLTHIRHVEKVFWNVLEFPSTPADDSSSLADAAFSSLAAAVDGNESITETTLTFSERPNLAAGVCQSMKGLLGLTSFALCGCSTLITGEEAVSMSEVLHVKSLRRLDAIEVMFADVEASLTFGNAIAQSALTSLYICLPYTLTEEMIPLDVPTALTGSRLRELQLKNVTFLDYHLAMAFCKALAGCQLRSLVLDRLKLHADAINAFGRSVCRPCLERLEVVNSLNALCDAIGKSLSGAPNLQVLQIRAWLHSFYEDTVVSLLGGCCSCPSLVELSLGDITSWTAALDEAAAECIRHCRKLVKITVSGTVWKSPAFLRACQAHQVIEEIRFPVKCPELRAALALVTTKNKETRVYRSHFEKLAGDGHGRAAFSRVLAKVNNKPHLTFLALTLNKHLVSGGQN